MTRFVIKKEKRVGGKRVDNIKKEGRQIKEFCNAHGVRPRKK